jgi:hypothetical protein
MSELEKRLSGIPERRERFSVKEIATYSITSVVITALLLYSGFPLAFLFFIGSAALLMWRMLGSSRSSSVRPIFEFYLFADEIISNPRRRWFGFEIDDVIRKGNELIQRYDPAPPLVFVAMAALYRLRGDTDMSEKCIDAASSLGIDESSVTEPTSDMREYASLLRRIENAPEESPKVARAIRRLERLRNTGLNRISPRLSDRGSNLTVGSERVQVAYDPGVIEGIFEEETTANDLRRVRQPITEVLHSVYDQAGEKDA